MKEIRFDSVEEVLEDIRNGKIVVVTDDEDRENEGDLICSARAATPENVNFMAKYAKGLICMPMSKEIADRLELYPMVSKNTDNHETAFTVTIDHVDTTTGISAYERSHTALMCIDKNSKPSDFRRPGHMFPLIAKKNGVLERNGHTEATVDLMRLSGVEECGLCCEIMRDNGTMMRTEELYEFSKKHGLKFTTIKAIQHYIKINERHINLSAIADMPTKYGRFKAYSYIDTITGLNHIALVYGKVNEHDDVLVRVHSECMTGDVFGSLRCDCGEQFAMAMKKIVQKGEGALLYMRQEGRGIGLENKIKAYALQENGLDTVEANIALGFEEDLRDYDIAAQIIKDLGIKSIELMTNNPDKIEQLTQYEVKISKRVPVQIEAKEENLKYQLTKKEKMRHIINL